MRLPLFVLLPPIGDTTLPHILPTPLSVLTKTNLYIITQICLTSSNGNDLRKRQIFRVKGGWPSQPNRLVASVARPYRLTATIETRIYHKLDHWRIRIYKNLKKTTALKIYYFRRHSNTTATLRQYQARKTNFYITKSTSIFQQLHFYKLQYTIT